MLKNLVSEFTVDLKNIKNESVVALIYCAVILTCMEYFLIPPRAEALLQGAGLGRWYEPSLWAGLIWSLGCLVGFLIVPALVTKFIYKRDLRDIGFNTKGFFKHLPVYLLLYLFMVPLIYLASQEPHFKDTYPFIPAAKLTWRLFLIWEIAYVLQFFCLEFFFRGYLLFNFEKHMQKFIAIAVMVVPYVMIHFHKPVFETFGAIAAGVVLGWLSLRYRSWLGGALLHSLVAVTLDSLATYGSSF